MDSNDQQLHANLGKTGGWLADNLALEKLANGSTNSVAALIFTEGITTI